MAKFEIEDFTLDGKKTLVTAPGVVEAMHEYLPRPSQNISVHFSPSKGEHEIIDLQTDCKYLVRLL